MNTAYSKLLMLGFVFFMSGCSLQSTTIIQPLAKDIRIYHDRDKVLKCRFIADVIGTEGHWYNYLFITNKALTQGALDDMKNQANKVGANSIYLRENMRFTTSVTFLGQAYLCLK